MLMVLMSMILRGSNCLLFSVCTMNLIGMIRARAVLSREPEEEISMKVV